MSRYEQLDLFDNSLDHDQIVFCDLCSHEYNLRFHTMCPKCRSTLVDFRKLDNMLKEE